MLGSIPTRKDEGQEHPEQAGERHEAWIPLLKCAQFCLKLRVPLCSWQHMYIEPQVLCDSFKQEVGFVISIRHVVCAQMGKMSGSPQTFTLSIFLSLVIKLG